MGSRGAPEGPRCFFQLVPPLGMLNNPMNAVTTKFVRTSTNKVKCPVFVIRVRVCGGGVLHRGGGPAPGVGGPVAGLLHLSTLDPFPPVDS